MTTDTPRSATDVAMDAVEMSHAETPMSATLEPMVRALRRTESATQFQEPLRKLNNLQRMDCLEVVIGNWGLVIRGWSKVEG